MPLHADDDCHQLCSPAETRTERLDSVVDTWLVSDLRRWPSSMIWADQSNLRSSAWSCNCKAHTFGGNLRQHPFGIPQPVS